MKKFFLSFLVVYICLPGFAQNTDSIFVRKLADEILVNSKAYHNLRDLTKNIGARLAGSKQMTRSEQWGLRLMNESGADTAWMQECLVPHWDRGGKDQATAMYTGKKKSLDILALGNSIGTGEKGLTARVVMVRNFDELEQMKDQVKGAIVFYNHRFIDTYIHTFSSYREASQYRGQGPSRAAKYGAVAVIVRSMSHAADNSPHTGATRYDSAYNRIPAAAIGLRDADWLAGEIKKGSITITLKTNGQFYPDVKGHNIIGEIRGSEFPNEYITVGGHLDSWDVGEGAHDDGAGCVQTIEILRAFNAIGYKPKRSIRFVLFANEENGLRGGNKYAEVAKVNNERHILAIESDAGGFTPRGFCFTGSDTQFEKFLQWKSIISPYGCNEFIRGGGGADIGPLNRAMQTPLVGLNPDSQRYFDIHHARTDVFEAVNKRELELGAVNMAALIYLADKYGL